MWTTVIHYKHTITTFNTAHSIITNDHINDTITNDAPINPNSIIIDTTTQVQVDDDNSSQANDYKRKKKKKPKNATNFASWNCRRGILSNTNEQTAKIHEMEDYMNENKIDVMTINEADLFGKDARIMKAHPIDEETLKPNLHLEGYKVWLPRQWEV